MLFDPVLTKLDFARRYRAQEFGNAAPTWDTRPEYLASGYSGKVHIRNRVAGADTWYDVSPQRFEDFWGIATNRYPPELLYISAMAPEHKKIFQGEVQQSKNHLDLFYSCLPLPMRDGLRADGRQVSGILAVLLCRYFMCPNSWEWLQVLLDRYPGHVVEFSAYSVCWGTIPHYNCVFWEVRSY